MKVSTAERRRLAEKALEALNEWVDTEPRLYNHERTAVSDVQMVLDFYKEGGV